MADKFKTTAWVSATCAGETCALCGRPAAHKIGEEIACDDPLPYRHNLTAYVCVWHFEHIMHHNPVADSQPPVSAWRRRQNTPISIPFSLAYALWDFCCSKGRHEDARHLMDAINAVFPGHFK